MTCTYQVADDGSECRATAYYIDGSTRWCAYHLAQQAERVRKACADLGGPEARKRNRSQLEQWAIERATKRTGG